MPSQVYFENHLQTPLRNVVNLSTLKEIVSQKYCVPCEDLFVTINGKVTTHDPDLQSDDDVVRIHCRLVGGKGGFGSMLRAIGAQIEKTTNREACRDLSGRRLRDINEEKRLRKWLDGQADREREAVERKQKKLERLVAEPKIVVNLPENYEKERQDLPDRVSAAVDAGWDAAGSSGTKVSTKRKAEDAQAVKKKSKLWIDAEMSDCSSGSDSDDDDDETVLKKSSPVPTVSTDSGNDSDRASEVSSKV